jgi:hypothetical protein
MRRIPALLLMLIALALTGAPFGMGRMMDNSAGHSMIHQAHQMDGMDHGSAPSHDPTAPHYVVCSACLAASAPDAFPVRIILEGDGPISGDLSGIKGSQLLPPVPPPRV